eukprot:scaffold100935_cov29-Tisochrysis_lutea.AAC.4
MELLSGSAGSAVAEVAIKAPKGETSLVGLDPGEGAQRGSGSRKSVQRRAFGWASSHAAALNEAAIIGMRTADPATPQITPSCTRSEKLGASGTELGISSTGESAADAQWPLLVGGVLMNVLLLRTRA